MSGVWPEERVDPRVAESIGGEGCSCRWSLDKGWVWLCRYHEGYQDALDKHCGEAS